jgi:hypothetical protein
VAGREVGHPVISFASILFLISIALCGLGFYKAHQARGEMCSAFEMLQRCVELLDEARAINGDQEAMNRVLERVAR